MLSINLAYGQSDDISFDVYDSNDYKVKGRIVNAGEDEMGRIWFASNGGGIIIFDGYSFQNTVHIPGDTSTLVSNNVLSVFDLGEYMWAGNRYGFSTIDIQNLKIENYFHSVEGSELPENYIQYTEALLKDSSCYWISNYNRLIQYDKNFNRLNSFELPFIDEAANKIAIVRLVQDRFDSNRIWIGSLYGLFSFDKERETFEIHLNPKKWHNRSPEMQQYGYWDMFQSDDSVIHSAAMHSGGLMSFHPTNNSWSAKRYKYNPGQSPYLGNQAKSVSFINDSTFILNFDMGIAFINIDARDYKEWKGYNVEKYGNARDNFIDSKGHLWICADNAILRSKKPVNRDAKIPIYHLSTAIEGYHSDSKSDKIKKGKLKASLTLNNPTDKDVIEYQYRLCNSDWESIGNRRIIDLFNIGYGTHFFNARAREGLEGEWKYAQPLSFEIERPFYLKPYNLTFFGIIMLGIFYGFWYLTRAKAIRDQKIKHSFEKKILESEMRALRSQMNPHFIFNSLNSIYNFILQNETEQAADYLTKFSKLIRRVLNNSKEMTTSLDEEIKTLRLYLDLEMVRIRDKFEYTIHVDTDISASLIFIPTMLIQPHLENAIWHGLVPKSGKGHIEMDIKRDSKILVVKITDNGVGRKHVKTEQALKVKSLGSTITNDRLNLMEELGSMGGEQEYIDLKDKDGTSKGTQVILKIPFTINTEA